MNNPRPWLNHYDSGVPASLAYPRQCVHDFIRIQEQCNPGRSAVIIGDDITSYKTLHSLVANLACDLIKIGIKPGERVGICLPNSLEFVVAFFAVLQAGGIVAAMNPLFPRRELEFQIATAKINRLITNFGKVSDFQSVEKECRLEIIVIADKQEQKDDTVKFIALNAIVESQEIENTFPEIDPSSAAVLQFSGGTTGTPKAAIGTHLNLVANVTQFRRWLANLEDGKETFLIAIPLYHVYGLVLGLILGAATGATLVFVEKPGDVDEMLALIHKYPISYFPAVPSLFNMINNHPGVIQGKFDLHTIKACISGSAPLLEAVRTNFEKFTGGSLVEGYGLSEAPTATHCNPVLGEKRSGSIGLPLPDVECKIVSVENDLVEMEQGYEGELLIRGPQVMTGYFNAPVESAAVLRAGWLHTGDIARMDNEGYFYLSGRIKDLIKVHGMQVWPLEVEEVLSKHPWIKECAVAGVPDDDSGERVKAWLILRPGENICLDEVRRFCKGKLAAYKIPSLIKIYLSLPKTPVGKVLRRELVREHMEGK